MRKYLILLIAFTVFTIQAQEYKFTDVIDIESSSVKSQDQTGTCWSFSTSSFIESEIFRLLGENVDISEMYTVRNTYEDKAWNYVMRQGKIQFSEGGLAHDVINSIRDNGLVPEITFSGVKFENKTYNHAKIIPEVKKVLDTFIKNGINSKYPNWKKEVSKILDKEIGKPPTTFSYNSKTYSPHTFSKAMKINTNDYVTLTSFTQAPFYRSFVLNIPDNFSNGSMYNLPLNEFVEITTNALNKGYTISLDVDVSEKTFSAKYGLAVLPNDESELKKSLTELVKEKTVTQKYRQQEFENYNTTDDHLMHIVGIVKDQKDNIYYKVKNSWGGDSKRVGNGGYIYMSVSYFKSKAISVLMHKNALPKKIRKKI